MNTLLLSINWNPNPELFNLFGISIRYYGLLWAVGIFFAYIIVHYQFRDKKIDEKKFDPVAADPAASGAGVQHDRVQGRGGLCGLL